MNRDNNNNKINLKNINLKSNLYLLAKLDKKTIELVKKNPHTLEYFINMDNIYIDDKNKKCINCYKYKLLDNEEKYEDIYQSYLTQNIDKFKIFDNYYQNDLIYKLEQIPYKIKYELTLPKPKTVIHWGQLKMFLITYIFLLKTIKETDDIVNIVYAGSAPGDNILILCDMFPNTRWYLIDPRDFTKNIYEHKQIIETKNEFFTDEIAKYYFDKFKNRKNKLLFISDIRIDTKDEDIIRDQNNNANWHKIIQPDFSYLKFRCPYFGSEYKYLDGTIYIQPYAPQSSTETRLLLTKDSKEITYNIYEYAGKMYYFNRILRPSCYKKIIKDNKYFDCCYDCTYYSYLMKNYIIHFSKFNKISNDVYELMIYVINRISKTRLNKLKYMNENILKNIH
jgi:hypothetical protein